MGQVVLGPRGPDGARVRIVNGTAIPIPGTEVKQANYNPGTAAQRMAARMFQQGQRQRAARGLPAKYANGREMMAAWRRAEQDAAGAIAEAHRKRIADAIAKRQDANTFDLNEYLPWYLRPDRGQAALERGVEKLGGVFARDPGAWDPELAGAQSVFDTEFHASKKPDVKPKFRDWVEEPFQEVRESVGILGGDAPGGMTPTALARQQQQPRDDSNLLLGGDAPSGGLSLSDPRRPLHDAYRAAREDPAVNQYLTLLEEYRAKSNQGLTGMDVNAEGQLGTSDDERFKSLNIGLSAAQAFPYLLVRDPTSGKLSVETAQTLYAKLNSEALRNPERAGELMAAMAAIRAYGGGAEKYVESRVAPIMKDGQPTLVGQWSTDDSQALTRAVTEISRLQAGMAESGQFVDFETLLADQSIAANNVSADSTFVDGGGGGGGGRRYGRGGGGGGYYGGGGGGGGGGGQARVTDSEQLKSLIDGIARTRMGRALTVQEAQEFANYYHGLESAMYSSYSSGGAYTMLDPEGQAVAWIESRYREEGAKQAHGTFVMTLMKMLQGGAFAGLGESS